MAIQIITNHRPRFLKYGYELAPKWRKEFDWMDEEEFATSRFVEYKGWVYSLEEFTNCEPTNPFYQLGFDGYASDTYFSGVLIKIVDDDTAIVARYFS